MSNRRFIGDVMLAVLISAPSVALARQGAVTNSDTRAVQRSEAAPAPAADRQVGLSR